MRLITLIDMFTGIIESLGTVENIERKGSNLDITIKSDISDALKIDQSISHNGVCLTVTKVADNTHTVTAIDETLQKSNLGALSVGSTVNLERCTQMGGRLDGHIVQGHVDLKAKCTHISNQEGSWLFDFELPETDEVLVEKGSVCINGVSLTCFNVTDNSFRVAIIPYTFEHTTFKNIRILDEVNVEFDIIGKYVKRLLNKNS